MNIWDELERWIPIVGKPPARRFRRIHIDRIVVPPTKTDPYAFELWWCDREHDPGDEDRS